MIDVLILKTHIQNIIGFFPQHLRSPQKSHEECLFFDLKKQEEFVRKVGEEGRKEGERGRGMEEDYERRLNENERVLERILSEIEENFFFIGLTDRFFIDFVVYLCNYFFFVHF